jgi:predicted amidohydrolase
VKNKLKIVGIQADLIWENPSQNIAFFESKIETLALDIDIIVLPEMYTSGFTMHPQKVAETMEGFSISWMQKIAKEKQVAICGSLVIAEYKNNMEGEQIAYYNRFVFVTASGNICSYDKRHSFTLAGEDKVYTSGTEHCLIHYKGWKICPMICYDLRFPVWSRNTSNYDLLIYVANWPKARIKAWDTLLKARAIENMSYVVGLNRIGKDAHNYDYPGNSLIIDYLGAELSCLEQNELGIIAGVLVKSDQTNTRGKLGFLKDQDYFKIFT